jgi:hypothetical protein
MFSENSAVEGGVFGTESESVIKTYNTTITNNFAVTAGVMNAHQNGNFEMYNTNIVGNKGYSVT